MSEQLFPPGLYDHPLNSSINQLLANQAESLHHLQPLDPAEAPQRLARYLRQLSEIALASLPAAQRQQKQLSLVNQIVGLLQQHSSAIGAGDLLHPSARLLQELRDRPLLPSNSLRASSSCHQAPITGLIENSDSWLGVIRRVGIEAISLEPVLVCVFAFASPIRGMGPTAPGGGWLEERP